MVVPRFMKCVPRYVNYVQLKTEVEFMITDFQSESLEVIQCPNDLCYLFYYLYLPSNSKDPLVLLILLLATRILSMLQTIFVV